MARIRGTRGNDTLNGTAGDDVIIGQHGNDTLNGGDGNDRINGEAGNDQLFGGDGNDSFHFASIGGNDTIHDWNVGDSIVLGPRSGLRSAVQVGDDVHITYRGGSIDILGVNLADIDFA